MRGRNRLLAVIAVWSLVGLGALFSGCSDDNPTVAATTVTGTEFTSATMQPAASVGVSTVDLMYNISAIFAGLAVRIQPPALAPAGPSPLAPIPIPGGSGLCLGGATLDNVVWNDLDNNQLPTVGDTIAVTIDNCILDPLDPDPASLSGTPNPAILFTLTDNASLVPPFTLQGTLALNLTFTDSFGSQDINGIMPAIASTPDRISAAIFLGTDSGTSANTQITLSESGTSLAFGCFNVHLDFPDVTIPGNFGMIIRGITRMTVGNASQIMQVGTYDAKLWLPLNFVSGVPASGELKLLSYDSRASVPGLSSCYETVTGTTSEVATALGGSLIRLDTFKNTTWTPPPDNTVTTDWFTLLD